MTRDIHLKDTNAPAFSATPPPGTTPAPNNRTVGDSRAPKGAVDKVEAALSESTLQFLQERGIDPREYADAYANGELKDSSGVDEFFATHSNSSTGKIPENGLGEGGEISEATAHYRAKIDQLADLYEGAGDDLGTTNSRSRGFSEEDSRAKEVAAYDDSSEELDSDGVSQKEKHALLSFVEEWWTNTTGGKKQKAAAKKNQSRAFSQNESRQKVSPPRPGNAPRRTIFDIAGDTYRRNQTS